MPDEEEDKMNLPGASSMSGPLQQQQDASEVAEFFKDRSVFITGATGFIGKVLLEKLLRSCSRVRTVYVLMRPKEGQDLKKRIDELFTLQIFDRIRRENPTILTKVVPINGDILLPGLGISNVDTAMLCKHVSVVVHSAANVRFDEPLKRSVQLNVVATQKVLQLCQGMSKLAAMIHVSTAYGYCNRKEIGEIVYPERVPAQRVIEAVEWMDEDFIQYIQPKLMDGRPTTYHYTKALAEHILVSEGENLPIAIIRPSIVTAAFKEPIPGWVDGVNGPSTFIIATARGLLRTMLVHKHAAVDWVPVDLVANLILTACWDLGKRRESSVKVYNCTSGNLNRVTWADIEKTAYPLITRHPSINVLRYPGGSFKSNRLLNKISVKLEHGLPARILDSVTWIFGYKTEFSSMVARMERATSFFEFFTTKQWTFHCDNLIDLMERQSQVDRQLFNFDIRPIEWTPYFEDYVLGIRKFILKEDESTLPAARRRLARLYYAGLATQCLFVYACFHLILTRTNISNRLMWTMIGIVLRVMQYMPRSWLKAMNLA